MRSRTCTDIGNSGLAIDAGARRKRKRSEGWIHVLLGQEAAETIKSHCFGRRNSFLGLDDKHPQVGAKAVSGVSTVLRKPLSQGQLQWSDQDTHSMVTHSYFVLRNSFLQVPSSSTSPQVLHVHTFEVVAHW